LESIPHRRVETLARAYNVKEEAVVWRRRVVAQLRHDVLVLVHVSFSSFSDKASRGCKQCVQCVPETLNLNMMLRLLRLHASFVLEKFDFDFFLEFRGKTSKRRGRAYALLKQNNANHGRYGVRCDCGH